MNVSPLGLAAAALPAGVPAQRVPVSSGQLLTACRLAWEQDGRLVALWASDERDRKRGFCVRVVLEDRDGLTLLEHQLPHPDSHYPGSRADLPGGEPDAARRVRPRRHRLRRRRPAAVGVDGVVADRPLSAAPRFRRLAEVGAGTGGLRVRPRRGRRRARDPRRAGARRHHRAGAFPLPDRRRKGAAARGAAGLRAQGDRKAIRVDAARRGQPARGPRLRRLDRRVCVRVCAGAGGHRRHRARRRAPRGCARWRSSASASPTTWATSAILGNDGGFAFGLAQFSRLQGGRAAAQPARVRPPAADGLRRAGRRRAATRCRTVAPRCATQCARSSARSTSCATSTTSTPACRTASAAAASSARRSRRSSASPDSPDARAAHARDLRCDFPFAPYDTLGVRIATRHRRRRRRARRVRFDELKESLRLVRTIVDALPDAAEARCARRCRSRRRSSWASATSKAGAGRC